jgi:glycosyltransferase involved in cell wall biosynthesis
MVAAISIAEWLRSYQPPVNLEQSDMQASVQHEARDQQSTASTPTTHARRWADPAARHMRVALVHDWLNQMGGAENVLEEMVALFPGAPIYTSMYDAGHMPESYRQWPIHTSFMQRLPGVLIHHQRYLPVYPIAFGATDLSSYDLVISNKSGFCHGVKSQGAVGQAALHVCYCLTPTRFLWLFDQYREREQMSALVSAALRPLMALLRRWDYAAAQRVDHFIAISTEVQRRIRQVYRRESVVIHPPVDTEYFTPDPAQPVGDAYLIVSRLIPYKRIDLAVQAFNRLPDLKLVIVGDGRDLAALKAQAQPNISFVGRQSRERVRDLLAGCRAFIFPGLEDFGIAPVEAMSVGRPVIAFAGGGALDTVIPGVSGELFASQTPQSLVDTLQRFDHRRYCSHRLPRAGRAVQQALFPPEVSGRGDLT